MNNIKITVELCKEDRQRVDELIGLAGWITGALKDMAAAATGSTPTAEEPKLPHTIEQAEDGTVKLVKNDHPADAPTTHLEPPAAEPDPEPVPEVKPVSFPEFQKAVTQAVAKGPKQKAAAKEIINKYAASVSAVPEDKRAEVMAELAKI